MLNFISKFLMPQKIFTFFTAARNFLKGKKTYLAATIILLQALLSYIDQTLAITSLSGFLDWARALLQTRLPCTWRKPWPYSALGPQ